MTVLIKGGRVVDPSQDLDRSTDLLIEDGKISRIGAIEAEDGWQVLDVSGAIVAPGFIDMHVHLREPGQEYKETIETGVNAAVAGGFTGVMCMPNTDPVNDCEAVTRYIREKAEALDLAEVYPAGAVTKGSRGEELAEIGEMVKAGAVAISDDGRPVQNSQIMRRALEYAKIFGIPVLDHCEDVDLAACGVMNEGSVSTQLGMRGLHGVAEELQVARDLMLARLTKSRVHICHISDRESLKWVRRGKEEGVRITCEVTPHHFLLTEEKVRGFDPNYKMNPPLRTEGDVEAMLAGLEDGTIDCIATDHAPHAPIDKDETFQESANGIIGLETAVPLVWNFLVGKGSLSESHAVRLLSCNPARILGIDRGTLKVGSVADVTVIDPELEIEIDVSSFRSKARNCPFHGWSLRGVPVKTLVGGKVVYERVT